MSKHPSNRTGLDHIKQGFKNIPATYKALYNQPKAGPGSPGKGPIKTAAANLKFVAKGPAKSRVMTPEQKSAANKTRAAVVGMGAASVTPLGPVAAFAMGVKKSIAETKKAVGATKPTPPKAPPKLAVKPTGAKPGATPPKAPPKPAPAKAPKPVMTPQAKAALLKKNLNSAFPGLNMK